MATTLHGLKTYYDNVMRSDFSHIPAAHLTLLTSLSSQVDGGAITLAAAQAQVVRLAVDTTSVASLAYNFFTGSTPYHHGFDYLVAAGGANPNNLNSAYYQAFNVENRYINFAMNLGKAGEGAAWFSANYGALTMGQAVAKAYAEIFGTVPDDAKIDELLNSQVPDGRGGAYTRNTYFATYGGDGLEGIGTKAAMVGWLLAAAAKEDVGTYAKANDAFLADLATDGVAFFRGELVTIYGTPAVAAPGDDTITVTGDLAVGQTLAAGAGHDKITVTGTVYGRITADGDDTLVLGRLGLTPGSLGVPEQISSVTLTGGGNTVWLKGGSVPGATVTATGMSNTLHVDGQWTLHEGTVSGFQTVYLHSASAPTVQGATVIYDVVNDPTYTSTVSINAYNRELVVLKDTPNGVTLSANGTTDQSARVDVHLQNFMGAPTTKESVGRGYYAPDGGAIVFYARSDGPLDNNGTLALHVDTDSTAGMIVGFSTNSALSPNYRGPVPNLIIDGAGKLTAQIAGNFTNIDASQAGDLDLSYRSYVSTSEQIFRLGDGTNNLRIYFNGSYGANQTLTSAKFYLGAGVDTISLGAGGYETAAAASGPGAGLVNLAIVNDVLQAPPQIIGFQKGVDHLVLDTQIHAITAYVQAYADGKATLQDALAAVSAHVAAKTGAVFTWGGDTYVYAQDSQAGVNMVGGTGPDVTPIGDGLIKLTGVTGLTVGTGAGSYDIHYG